MRANHQPETAPCGPDGAADLASAAPLRRTGWPAGRGFAQIATALGLSLLLSACAMPRMIDSQVQSFVGPGGAALATSQASYRFERLPSQQTQEQDRVEAMAQTALQEVGLHRATATDVTPRYSVQVDVQVMPIQIAPRRSMRTIAPFVNVDGSPVYSPLIFMSEPPWYLHSAHFVLRDLASGHIAFETTGRFEGPWSDSLTLWPVVMRAALQGYPNPPSGIRTVTIELPATPAPAP